MVRSAVAFTVVTAVPLLLPGVGSVVPSGTVACAVLLMSPVAPGVTVPPMVKVRLLFAGRLLSKALTVLPVTRPLDGQIAPPVALPQLALTLLIEAGTISVKLVPLATLGPKLLTTTE